MRVRVRVRVRVQHWCSIEREESGCIRKVTQGDACGACGAAWPHSTTRLSVKLMGPSYELALELRKPTSKGVTNAVKTSASAMIASHPRMSRECGLNVRLETDRMRRRLCATSRANSALSLAVLIPALDPRRQLMVWALVVLLTSDLWLSSAAKFADRRPNDSCSLTNESSLLGVRA